MRFLILFLILFPVVIFGQIQSKWTTIEIGEADVARSITGISDFEKDVILYAEDKTYGKIPNSSFFIYLI